MVQNSTRALVFGAFMAALTVVFNAATLVIPVVFHLPLPTALVTMRHGWRMGLLSGVAASFLTFFFFGWQQVIMLVTVGLLPGLMLGWAIGTGKRATVAGFYTTLAALVGMLLGYAFSLLFFQEPPLGQLIAQMSRSVVESLEAQAAGLPPEQAEAMRQTGRQIAESLPKLIPFIFASGAAAAGVVSYQLAAWAFPRFGHAVEPLPRFSMWSLPKWVMWAYPAFVLPVLLVPQLGYQTPIWLVDLNTNVLAGVQILFLLQGMSVASWWLQGRGWSVRAANWTGILGGFFLSQLAVFLGLFDLALDFRRLRGPRPWETE